MTKAIIVDCDGTLVDVRSIRHHLIPPTPKPKGWFKDFHAFHTESVSMPVIQSTKDAVTRAHMMGVDVVVVTARRHMYRHHTAWFLALNGIHSDALIMRGNKDGRPDYEVKADMLKQIQARWDVLHAYDDNPSIIKLWKENNIPTTIVEGWGF